MNRLIKKYFDGTLTAEERKLLKKWVLDSDENRRLFKKEIIALDLQSENDFDVEAAFERFSQSTLQKRSVTKVIRMHTFLKYAAVFAGLLALGLFSKFLITQDTTNTQEQMVITQPSLENDAIVIKLADGTTQILDEHGTNSIMDAQGNLIANKSENILRFENVDSSNSELIYNEISVPNGKKIKLELSDGSTVFLNSGTSFKFPQRFVASNDTRNVFLTGEAFFDVAKDKAHPFIVKTGDLNITVLGTQFNVSAYKEDQIAATTLIEGSVAVYEDVASNNKTILVPSEQLRYTIESGNFSKEIVDTSIYTAWMQDKLIINSLRFDQILSRLERRDDVIIINHAKNLNQEMFKGEFTNESVETILKTMALSTPFEYRINNNTITILNKK
jgi:ferric-dicitrate binding protein FerR (iron transport regulator)